MVKLFALHRIIRTTKDGAEEEVPRRTVFEATPTEAKQYDVLKSARPATKDEIKRSDELRALADGKTFAETVVAPPPESTDKGAPPVSIAAEDPNGRPQKAG
jgi:hypothetical protein